MRPPAKRRKNHCRGEADGGEPAQASMRPPAKRRKNPRPPTPRQTRCANASMRPPAKRRKNSPSSRIDRDAGAARFNEAACKEAEKPPGRGCVRRLPHPHASMRPPAKRRKNPPRPGAALQVGRGASMRPPAKRRKNHLCLLPLCPVEYASMRPPAKRRKNSGVGVRGPPALPLQ